MIYKMKKILLTLVAFMVTVALNAEQVSKQQALLKAQQFMPGKQFGEAKAFARGESASPAENEAFYIFNAEGKKGFVIVSGDDRTEPILGYSDRGCLNVDSVPDNVKGLLNYYEKVLTAIANDKSYIRPAKTRGGERSTVEPLLWTEWGQGQTGALYQPFNMKCPIINNKWSVTGCVATAMAQIINYHQWPKNETSAVPAYITETYHVAMPQLEPIKFPWGFMGKWDIANLMLYCGQSIQMDYGVDGSGANSGFLPDVLKNIFHYSDKAQCILKEDYSEEEWEDIIYQELLEKRPVHYSGFPERGDGHAFIVDGYESGRFHVDWGWDGMSNGHFLLTRLNGFNHYQDAVIGIQPPEGVGEVIRPKVIVNGVSHGDAKYFWRQSDGNFPAFEIGSYVYGATAEKETLQFGWGLCNKDGLIAVYGQNQSEIGPDFSEGGYWHNASVAIENDIADGEYTIIPLHRSNDSESWVADIPNIFGQGVNNKYYTDLCIHDNVLALRFNYEEGGSNFGAYSLVEVRNYVGIYTDTANGISYDLWEDSGKKRATVIPSKSGQYSGDLFIPDVVSYNGEDYDVYEADRSAFCDCPDLKSLSTSMYVSPQVRGCFQLTKLVFREGVSIFDGEINNNPNLLTIEFPKSLRDYYTIFAPWGCDNLSSIEFKREEQIMFYTYPDLNNSTIKDIYFHSVFPPGFDYDNDDFKVNENTTIHIPLGSISAYQNTVWNNGKLIDDLSSSTPSQIVWGYGLNNDKVEFYELKGFGAECPGKILELAIHVPSEMIQAYINKKITGIEFYFYGGTMYCPDYAFITKSGTTDYLIKQATSLSVGERGWCTIPLSEPYVITGDELYVGLARNNEFWIPYSNIEYTEPDGCWVRQFEGEGTNGVWENSYESVRDICHPLTLRFVIEGEDFPKDIRLCYPKVNNEKVEVMAVNRSTDLLTSYTVNWDFDGKIKGSKTIDTRLASGLAEMLDFDIPSELSGYQHTLTIDVISVNGEDDAIPANSHLAYYFTTDADTHYPRKIVMEEATGIWCGYSPLGIETIKQLNTMYPDDFIAIGLHTNLEVFAKDDMQDPLNYQKLIKRFPEVPSSLINRVQKISPDLNLVMPIIEEQKDNADAMISANAIFTSEDKTSVTVKTATKFGFTQADNADFRIAYVIVEDNVGPYLQANNYCYMQDEQYPYMNDWFGLGGETGMVEMLYDNVARGIYGGLNGTEGSVPTSVVAGQPYEYEYTFDLPDNIQDKNNIRIVTLLIDNKSGEIMNADQTKVIVETDKDGDANNDNEVDDKDVEAVVRYIMNGDIKGFKGFNFKNADVNGDNKINAADIVEVMNIIKTNK